MQLFAAYMSEHMSTEKGTKGDSASCYQGVEKKLEGKRKKKGEG